MLLNISSVYVLPKFERELRWARQCWGGNAGAGDLVFSGTNRFLDNVANQIEICVFTGK